MNRDPEGSMLFASTWEEANRPSPRDGKAGGDAAVVLVIGSLRSRATFRPILEAGGYDVREAEDADEGLRLARKLRPAVILLELAMPVRDGWSVCRQLKSDADTSLIPIVATTLDRLPSGSYHRTRSAGFVDCVARPVERRHVLEVVGAWVKPRAGTPA
jgi:CheY-like chemotaxis protein